MKWTEQKSLKLSIALLYLLGITIICTIFLMPKVIRIIVPLDVVKPNLYGFFFFTLEVSLVLALIVLYLLWKLLKNMGNAETFVEKNIRLLRMISWFCFGEALLLAVSASYYYPWLFVAGLIAFIGVIVRIVKNAFCHAFLLKEENDYTI